MDSVTISEARGRLPSLRRELKGSKKAVTVTSRGQPVLAILDHEFYESLIETLEILCDHRLMADLRRSIRELEQGRLTRWDRVKGELGL